MKYQKGFALFELTILIFIALIFGSWCWNAVKLASCDFEENYKCEVIHGVGLVVPPLSIITVWAADEGA